MAFVSESLRRRHVVTNLLGPWEVVRAGALLIRTAYRARRCRREIERLLALEPYRLDDLGVSHDVVRQALRSSDPAAALRRAARRAVHGRQGGRGSVAPKAASPR